MTLRLVAYIVAGVLISKSIDRGFGDTYHQSYPKEARGRESCTSGRGVPMAES